MTGAQSYRAGIHAQRPTDAVLSDGQAAELAGMLTAAAARGNDTR